MLELNFIIFLILRLIPLLIILLIIMVLEALSREFRTGTPWELLYADDLVIMADSLEECIAKLKDWKRGMEKVSKNN